MKITTLLSVIGLFFTSVVYSHPGAKGIIKERMDAMESMAENSSLVADMFKGKIEFEKHALVEAAVSFTDHGEKMAKLFPDTEESRTGYQTRALAKIWEQWEDFNARIIDFIALSNSLEQSALTIDDEDQLKKEFFKTAKSCSGCHRKFRKRE